MNEELKVKSLVAGKNQDINYPGIWLDIEDADGCRVPLVNAEIVDRKLNLYVYSDQHNDDFTHKFTIDLDKNDMLPAEP